MQPLLNPASLDATDGKLGRTASANHSKGIVPEEFLAPKFRLLSKILRRQERCSLLEIFSAD